jgi:hypothetical protein
LPLFDITKGVIYIVGFMSRLFRRADERGKMAHEVEMESTTWLGSGIRVGHLGFLLVTFHVDFFRSYDVFPLKSLSHVWKVPQTQNLRKNKDSCSSELKPK